MDLKQISKESIERLMLLRPIDDIFMRNMFKDNIPATQLVLRIILEKEDLKVISVESQTDLANLFGKSATLDVLATDSEGKIYNIEVQRQDKGAVPKRARYHRSLLDMHNLKAGADFDGLPELYVIFITEKDVLGYGLPIYHIESIIKEVNENFNDGWHIVYVNGEIKDDTSLGRLMWDFNCADPQKMKYDVLAEKAAELKDMERGGTHMCAIMEEAFDKIRVETRKEINENIAKMLIKDGIYSLEKIADMVSLPLERIKALAAD